MANKSAGYSHFDSALARYAQDRPPAARSARCECDFRVKEKLAQSGNEYVMNTLEEFVDFIREVGE